MPRFLAILCVLFASVHARPWTEDVMYFVLTDRFHDGDPENNTPPGCDPDLFDPRQKEIGRYHGGDLRGLELAIRAGYFNELGVTALWITPPLRNVWKSGPGRGSAGYHGYWAQDFLDIDPHLTSAVSLDGAPYPDGPEGRMRHYRDFVALAHSKGLKVVQDVVLNHAGPVFFYDVDGDGEFDRRDPREWIQPFKHGGFHDTATWGNVPEWNLRKTMPDGPRELLGKRIKTSGVLAELSSYGRKGFSSGSLGKSDGEEIECDFYSLRDLWTAPDSAHFDRLVDEFVEIYAFYLLEIGIDGLRIDTVKHAHHEFWDAFTERLRKRLGARARDKLLFGEIYDGDPAKLGRYTWRGDWPERTDPCLDGVLDFNVCFAAREYLRHPGDRHGHAGALAKALMARRADSESGRPFFNPHPGPDGKNSREKMVTFIENHDGLNRFRVAGITAERHDLAQALMMTLPGIPCLYYGAELALQDSASGPDQPSENGRLTLFPRDAAPRLAGMRDHRSFHTIARLAKLRRELPALREGTFEPLWVDDPARPDDDGLLAFARVTEKERVMLVFNASGEARSLGLPGGFAAGQRLVMEAIAGVEAGRTATAGARGEVAVKIDASSAMLLRAAPADSPGDLTN